MTQGSAVATAAKVGGSAVVAVEVVAETHPLVSRVRTAGPPKS